MRRFLNVALPTWLAEGNIPALAGALPTEFVLLTSCDDEAIFQRNPLFKRLCEICPVRIRCIDHLITGSNYSTTVTLAYLDAIRAEGEEMVDTCFLFLVSDYIVADGSFAHVITRMMAGVSGVLVGNFQATEEEALPWLEEQVGHRPQPVSLSPRELMMWGLTHLHPVTAANIVNHGHTHNYHANRLFWRVDGRTLLGRFFLMHMICLRPEVSEFSIGSSCDYSFVPEMCPSDNIEIVQDSDDYFVVELQPRHHEARFLRPGPHDAVRLAGNLSEWTTARHRKNAETTVIYHAAAVPEKLVETEKEADQFIAEVKGALRAAPSPHFGHPYWDGAIAAHLEAIGGELTDEQKALSLGLPYPALSQKGLTGWAFQTARTWFRGSLPAARSWHPRWPDRELVRRKLDDALGRDETKLLVLANAPSVFTAGYADGDRIVRAVTRQFLHFPPERFDRYRQGFDLCVVELAETELGRASELVRRIGPLLRDNGELVFFVPNPRGFRNGLGFGPELSAALGSIVAPSVKDTDISFVEARPLRWLAARAIARLTGMARNGGLRGKLAVLAVAPFLALMAIANRLSGVTHKPEPGLVISSALAAFTIDAEIAVQAETYSGSRITRRRMRRRDGYAVDGLVPPQDLTQGASEVGRLLGLERPAAAGDRTKASVRTRQNS